MNAGRTWGRMRAQLGYRWYRLKLENRHWKVELPDGSAGFGVVGDWRAVTHFSRYWLGCPDLSGVKIRRGVNGRDAGKVLNDMVSRYGMAVVHPSVTATGLKGVELQWPSLVELQIPIEATWEEQRAEWGKSVKGDLGRIKREGYRGVISRDISRVERFYREFYEPSMRLIHGANAYLFSSKDLHSIFRSQGEMLEIWRGDEWVGGEIYKLDDGVLVACALAWRAGAVSERRKGIVGALFVEKLKRALELGAKTLRLGGVPPYLEDGLMFFKTKWGARLMPSAMREHTWRVVINPDHPATRDFFRRYSLLYRRGDEAGFHVLSEKESADVPVAAKLQDGIHGWHDLDALKVFRRSSCG